MARTILLAALLATAAIPCGASAQGEHAPTGEYAPYLHRQLADGIHLLSVRAGYGGFATSNIVVVEQSDGVVVFDTGVLYGDGERVVALVRALGEKPVTHIVYSHWHNDHVEGAAAIRMAWPDAEIIASSATRDGLDGPVTKFGPSYERDPEWERKFAEQLTTSAASLRARAEGESDPARRGRLLTTAREILERVADIPGTVQVAPSAIVTDTHLLDDPERPIELRFMGRANTPGDIVAWMPRQKIVATGDIVVAPVPFGFYSFPADWIETLAAIRDLGFDLLVPGHGAPQDNPAYIDRLTAAITDLREQVAPLAAEGLDVDAVRERLDLGRQRDWFGTSAQRSAELENYWIRPMVDNVWREARGLPIEQGEGETP